MSNPSDTFAQEAEELLQSLEQSLLELEGAPGNATLVDAVFRALHTLKGSGDMFGFSALARFTHHFETAFDQVREGRARVSHELIAVALASRDHLAALLALGAEAVADAGIAAEGHALLARLNAVVEEQPAGAANVEARATRTWHIRFRPATNALRNGFRPDLLLAELAELGRLDWSCSDELVPAIEDLDASDCWLVWEMTLETSGSREAIDDVFLFLQDGEIDITAADEAPAEAETGDEPVTADKVEPQLETSAGPAAPKSDSVRVQSHRLDELMDQLGELVIAQARLRRISDELGDTTLGETAEEIERLVTGLRDATLSIRMLPISLVFGKFRRVVRDLSEELGKPAQLVTEGDETEVDKNVIDSLTEPLVHLIRNAIDHGIETPETRAAAGKPAAARVTLRARQAGGEVLISVTDNGGGLDADAIRRRAIERKLIAATDDLSEEALYQLIFEPGFSTAKALSSVSGRGVGMDAVRRVIEDLRGTVEVRSRTGIGTEVTLRLPLTLAIIDGLLVRVGEGSFVLPLASVEECVELPEDEEARQSGRSILRIRDQLVPFVALDTQFGFPPSDRKRRRVAIVSVEGRRVGLVVDDVLGQHQTVVKPLSAYHRGIEGLAGGTILGDGSVALILEVATLVRRAQSAPRIAA
ncbi:chemotaxis protein CheA [Roseitranquillus sediminis]|uniref:chemotaxis protein CheA n=1 Tax=Roseitranquillus sediminis TaxID=2809051 RepID=UPI001D0CBC30|nr:chemotaxis protein CheA [Roseitranquillus sediminis]MBM9593598.1 chemotaxis protein CheA [Roseitranquillus sediminis]